MKKITYLFLIPLFMVSCENAFETFSKDEQRLIVPSKSESMLINIDSVCILDKNANFMDADTLIYLRTNNNAISFDSFVQDVQNLASSETQEVGGPYTLVGYSSKELISTGSLMFSEQPVDTRLQANVYYLAYKYYYKYRITVPHGATVIIPNQFSETSKTGYMPDDEKAVGYKLVSISQSTNGDVYDLVTIVKEVSHNVSGQYLGFTAYLPFRVGNPSTDMIFKYQWITTDWGDM